MRELISKYTIIVFSRKTNKKLSQSHYARYQECFRFKLEIKRFIIANHSYFDADI